MASIPYMKFYAADYLADTAHLTTLEHGAYLLLILTYWQTGKPLPNDHKKLARICRMRPEKFKLIANSVLSFFKLVSHDGESVLIHKRIDEELVKFRKKSDAARVAGQSSAKKRWGEKVTDVKQTFNENITDVKQNGNHTDTDIDIKEIPTTNVVVTKKKVCVSWPEDFCVTDHHRELAAKNDWPNPDDEFEAFKDFHVSKGNRFADWDRAFYTWLRKAKEFKQSKKTSYRYEKDQVNYPGVIE